MPFVPGQSGNPNGRPAGSRNKRTKNLLDELAARGDKDPAEYLSEVITNHADPALKIQAARLLLPYKYSKLQAIPVPRYIEHPITLPEFQTVEDAETFLARIAVFASSGELDLQAAMELSTLTRNWLSAKYERDEMKLKMANANALPGQHIIKIQGGLPALPGTNITMPDINNGQRVNDTLLPMGPPDNGPLEPPPGEEVGTADRSHRSTNSNRPPIATKWFRATRSQSTLVSRTSDQRRQPRPNMSKNRCVYLPFGYPTPAQSTATHGAANACTGPFHGAQHTGNAAPSTRVTQLCINS